MIAPLSFFSILVGSSIVLAVIALTILVGLLIKDWNKKELW